MKIYICNAFSLSMLDRETQARFDRDPLGGPRTPRPVEDVAEWFVAWRSHSEIEVISAVGHADTAAIFSSILFYPVKVNRVSVKLDIDSKALIGQYIGPRLPEGATELPEGARIEWWFI